MDVDETDFSKQHETKMPLATSTSDNKMEIDEIDGQELNSKTSSSTNLIKLNSTNTKNTNQLMKVYFEQLIQQAFGICLKSSNYENNSFYDEFINLDDLNDFNVLNFVQKILMFIVSDLMQKDDFESTKQLINDLNQKRTESTLSSFNDNTNTIFNHHKLIYQFKDTSVLVILYLMDCYFIIDNESKLKKTKQSIHNILSEMKEQCINYSILVLTNRFSKKIPYIFSALFPFILYQSAPNGFIPQIINNTFNEDDIRTGDFKEIFQPLLLNLWLSMQKNSSLTYEDDYMLPVLALVELCDIRVGSSRPICQLLVHLENWLPEEITKSAGLGRCERKIIQFIFN